MVLDPSHNTLKVFAEKLPPAAKLIVDLFDYADEKKIAAVSDLKINFVSNLERSQGSLRPIEAFYKAFANFVEGSEKDITPKAIAQKCSDFHNDCESFVLAAAIARNSFSGTSRNLTAILRVIKEDADVDSVSELKRKINWFWDFTANLNVALTSVSMTLESFDQNTAPMAEFRKNAEPVVQTLEAINEGVSIYVNEIKFKEKGSVPSK